MKLDILAIAAHPDDVELACSGTILKHIANGKKVGILDLTKGELGTRGNAEIRTQESAAAAAMLGISARENIALPDGFFTDDRESLLKAIQVIRKYQPDVVLCNAPQDRHPDHGRGSKFTLDACFLAGLVKIETLAENGETQARWRPNNIFHYIQDDFFTPDFVVDVTPFFAKRNEVIACYASQFFNPKSHELATPISGSDFWQYLEAKARTFGRYISVDFGEGYLKSRPFQVHDFKDIL